MKRHTRTHTQPNTWEPMLKSTDDRIVGEITAYKIFESEKYIYATFDVYVITKKGSDNGTYITIAGAHYSKANQKWYTPNLPKREGDKYTFSAWYCDDELFNTVFPELPINGK